MDDKRQKTDEYWQVIDDSCLGGSKRVPRWFEAVASVVRSGWPRQRAVIVCVKQLSIFVFPLPFSAYFLPFSLLFNTFLPLLFRLVFFFSLPSIPFAVHLYFMYSVFLYLFSSLHILLFYLASFFSCFLYLYFTLWLSFLPVSLFLPLPPLYPPPTALLVSPLTQIMFTPRVFSIILNIFPPRPPSSLRPDQWVYCTSPGTCGVGWLVHSSPAARPSNTRLLLYRFYSLHTVYVVWTCMYTVLLVYHKVWLYWILLCVSDYV